MSLLKKKILRGILMLSIIGFVGGHVVAGMYPAEKPALPGDSSRTRTQGCEYGRGFDDGICVNEFGHALIDWSLALFLLALLLLKFNDSKHIQSGLPKFSKLVFLLGTSIIILFGITKLIFLSLAMLFVIPVIVLLSGGTAILVLLTSKRSGDRPVTKKLLFYNVLLAILLLGTFSFPDAFLGIFSLLENGFF